MRTLGFATMARNKSVERFKTGLPSVGRQAGAYLAGQPPTKRLRGTIQSDGTIRVVVTVLLERLGAGSRLRHPMDVVLQP